LLLNVNYTYQHQNYFFVILGRHHMLACHAAKKSQKINSTKNIKNTPYIDIIRVINIKSI